MIYFAGYGHTEDLPGGGKQGYIVPADGNVDRCYSTCICMDKLREISRSLPGISIPLGMGAPPAQVIAAALVS